MLIGNCDAQITGLENQLSLGFAIPKYLTLLVMFFPVLSLHAQTLDIRLVDGRNGRPMVGASSYVNVWVGTERKEAVVIPTDINGVARLQLTSSVNKVNLPNSRNKGSIVISHPIMKYDETLQINNPYVLCGPGGSNYSWLGVGHLSMKEILEHGYASINTCGKVKVLPQPGQVVLFVRPLTFWEKIKQ